MKSWKKLEEGSDWFESIFCPGTRNDYLPNVRKRRELVTRALTQPPPRQASRLYC